MTKKKFLTPRELSERYDGRIHVRTLANWRSTQKGPPFLRLGGAVLYELGAIEQWERDNTKVAAPPE